MSRHHCASSATILFIDTRKKIHEATVLTRFYGACMTIVTSSLEESSFNYESSAGNNVHALILAVLVLNLLLFSFGPSEL